MTKSSEAQLLIGSNTHDSSTAQQQMDGITGQTSNTRQQDQEEDDAGVRHGVRQTQNATAHDGVAQVEDRHPEGGFTLKVCELRPL